MKVKIIAALLLITSLSFAQFSPGKLLIGGQGGYNTTKQGQGANSSKAENFGILPMLLIQLDSSVSIGLSGGFIKQDLGNSKNKEWKVGPVVRIQNKWKEHASFYFQLGVFYMNGTGTTRYDSYNMYSYYSINQNQTYTGLSSQLLPGVNYKLSKHFFLDLGYGQLAYEMIDIDYSYPAFYTNYYTAYPPTSTTNINAFTVDLSLQSLRVGAIYMF